MEKSPKKKKTSVYVDPILWEKVGNAAGQIGSNQTEALNEGLTLWFEANREKIAQAYAKAAAEYSLPVPKKKAG
jgi:hypothetical protein